MLKTRPRKAIANRTAKLAKARQPAARTASAQVCLGFLVGWDNRWPLVDFDGNPNGPVRARLSGAGTHVGPTGFRGRQEVVLLVDSRARQPPVLLGVLQPLDGGASSVDLEARVDGRRVEIEGRDEIVLRCGEASITLRRNGRVVIRGVQVETRASGVNRIKGGSVAIN
jgi:Domain of unknown function (DUF6484)